MFKTTIPSFLFLFYFSSRCIKMMLRVEESSLVEGFLVGRDRIRVSHLQFVDDTIFFSKASKEYEGLGLGLITLRNRVLLGKWD